MIPRRPPKERSNLPEDAGASLVEAPSLADDSVPSSRQSLIVDDSRGSRTFPVLVQNPEGLPAVVHQSEAEYVNIFDDLLAEWFDRSVPGYTDALEALVQWTEHEEATKVGAVERLADKQEHLKAENRRLHTELAEAMEQHSGASDADDRNELKAQLEALRTALEQSKEENERIRRERDEGLQAIQMLEADLNDKITEISELLAKIKELKKINAEVSNVQREAAGDDGLLPPPEGFVRAADFDVEGSEVEKLLRADVTYVNSGKESLIGWSDMFQRTVNGQVKRLGDPSLTGGVADEDLWAFNHSLYYSGFTVLHIAAALGSVSVVTDWLDKGISPTVTDARGNTIVHLCLMARPLREAGIGFTNDDDELSVIIGVCDWLKAKLDIESLLCLMTFKNKSDLSYHTYEQTGGGSLQAHSYFIDAVEYILTHRPIGISRPLLPRITDDPYIVLRVLRKIGMGVRYGSIVYTTNASSPGASLMMNRSYKFLTSLDQMKENLVSYDIMSPTQKFGDEKVITYSMLSCDQLGYAQIPEFVQFAEASLPPDIPFNSRLAFSTVGYVVSLSPIIERQTAHIVLLGNQLLLYSQPAFNGGSNRVTTAGDTLTAEALGGSQQLSSRPCRLSNMTKYNLCELSLLHLLVGYESTVLLRFRQKQPPYLFTDVLLETKYKPHLVLAVCVHYYNYCKATIPSISANRSYSDVEVSALPLQVDLTPHKVVPIYGKDEDYLPGSEQVATAVLVQTRFPHDHLLGESVIVSTKLCIENSRFLKPFIKVGTVYYNRQFIDWAKTPFSEDQYQLALVILYEDMTLEVHDSPVNDGTNCLYRMNVRPDSRPVTPIAFDSNMNAPTATGNRRSSGLATQAPSILSSFTKLFDISLIGSSSKAWYAIKFQEDPGDLQSPAVAIALEVKEERDEWMCSLFPP